MCEQRGKEIPVGVVSLEPNNEGIFRRREWPAVLNAAAKSGKKD